MRTGDAPKKVVLLSDGTGNSSAKLMRTNVWRMYEAVDLSTGDQIAMYDDGVGTSSFRPLAILGGALGWGLKRNVRELYMFACRNYVPAREGRPADGLYAFGFSRGAFTIRVLIALIEHQGLVQNLEGGELERHAKWAFREYRYQFRKKWRPLTPFVYLRNHIVRAWEHLRGLPAYDKTRNIVPQVNFVGVWDTVDAYGLPIDEMTRGWDEWVWPLAICSSSPPGNVDKVCHALSLDDERQTFQPNLISESGVEPAGHIDEERVTQVWFAGVHSNVGGGYPDDSLSYVPLRWMAREAAKQGLRLHDHVTNEWRAWENPHGPAYEPRRGLGRYYRYGPRLIRTLARDRFQNVQIDRPKIHESVFKRIAENRVEYAPIVLPERYAVVMSDGRVLADEDNPYEHPTQSVSRSTQQERVWNLVWLRRIAYFLTVAVSLLLVVPPFIAREDGGGILDQRSRALSGLIHQSSAVLPESLQPWVAYYEQYPIQLVSGIVALVLLFVTSTKLQGSIFGRMRRLWNEILDHGPRPVVPSPEPTDAIYRFRTHRTYRRLTEIAREYVFPFVFGLSALLAVGLIGAGTLNRALFAVASASGRTCTDIATRTADSANTWVVTSFSSSALCHPTGIPIVRGTSYTVQISLPKDWADQTIAVTSPSGFSSGEKPSVFIPALPFRRILTARWFVPMVRIGSKGAEYHALTADTTEFTPRRSGQLFLFVNDAVGVWPFVGYFYENNQGTATVTVKAK